MGAAAVKQWCRDERRRAEGNPRHVGTSPSLPTQRVAAARDVVKEWTDRLPGATGGALRGAFLTAVRYGDDGEKRTAARDLIHALPDHVSAAAREVVQAVLTRNLGDAGGALIDGDAFKAKVRSGDGD